MLTFIFWKDVNTFIIEVVEKGHVLCYSYNGGRWMRPIIPCKHVSPFSAVSTNLTHALLGIDESKIPRGAS